MRKLWLCI